MSSERWLPVRGFEDYYEVSDQGRVRSLLRTIYSNGGSYKRPGRILAQASIKTRRDGKSRKIVTVWGVNEKRWVHVSHLVLEAFIGLRPSPSHVTRHLNGDPSDNRLINLAWGTHAENVADTRKLDHIFRGEQHGCAKLTVKQVKTIRKLRTARVSGPTLALQFGVSHPLIYMIEKRKAWKHV